MENIKGGKIWPVYVVMFRWNNRSRWAPQKVYDSLSDARNHGWQAESPAEQKILKFVPSK